MVSTKLNNLEYFLYFSIWIGSFSYAFYCVYNGGPGLLQNKLSQRDFDEGWTILGRQKDISDDEWNIMSSALFKLFPWMFFHLIAAEFTRFFCPDILPLTYCLITFATLFSVLPNNSIVFFIIQSIMYLFAMICRSKFLVWGFAVGFLYIINDIQELKDDGNFNLSYDIFRLTALTSAWFQLKCIDFALSEMGSKQSKVLQYVDFLGYLFYLPLFFFGPFMPYTLFRNGMYAQFTSWNFRRLKTCIFPLVKYLFYFLLFEFLSHYFYCNAMHFEIKMFLPLGQWTVCGIGLCMAHFFFFKYVIVYGLSTTLARCEKYNSPCIPTCIYRVHLYSEMWRHFDKGFYNFLFKNIYYPACGSNKASNSRRGYASFLCFFFVYYWHGATFTIFCWATFNFIGLILESILMKMLKSEAYNKTVKMFLSSDNCLRINCLLVAPLWIFAVITNLMFFGGYELGIIYAKQIFEGSFFMNATLLIIAYAMVQASIRSEEIRKEIAAISCFPTP